MDIVNQKKIVVGHYWVGPKGLKQVKRNNLFFASLICPYVLPFLYLIKVDLW